jgi:hypothetical protein
MMIVMLFIVQARGPSSLTASIGGNYQGPIL